MIVKTIIVFMLSVLMLTACGSDDAPNPKQHAGECVVLLHGLAWSSLAMERMKWFLEENGYNVANIDCPSREHKIEALAPIAVEAGLEQCAAMNSNERIHFVTHSLGGILVRYYFSDRDLPSLGRVVMLGPPNQGSKAMDEMQSLPEFEWLNGRAGYQLGKGPESIPLQLGPPTFEFAVIAGDESIDPVTSAILDDLDDGRVSVSDTKLAGMNDFRLVGVSHAFMMQNSEVFGLVRDFLETGQFSSSEESTLDD